nr:hypothetical protein Iba_chr11aCG10620 [Ipomoea batatas]
MDLWNQSWVTEQMQTLHAQDWYRLGTPPIEGSEASLALLDGALIPAAAVPLADRLVKLVEIELELTVTLMPTKKHEMKRKPKGAFEKQKNLAQGPQRLKGCLNPGLHVHKPYVYGLLWHSACKTGVLDKNAQKMRKNVRKNRKREDDLPVFCENTDQRACRR